MSSSEDERPRFRQSKKRSQFPEELLDVNAISSQFAQKLLQERGFEITDEEFGLKKSAPVKKSNYISSLDTATLPELLKEFENSTNIAEACTLLKQITKLSGDSRWGVLRCEFLLRNKQLNDCIETANQLLKKEVPNDQRARILLCLSKATSDPYESLMVICRAFLDLKDYKQATHEPSKDDLLKDISDQHKILLSKVSRESKKCVHTLQVQGNSSTGCLGLQDQTQCSDLTTINLFKNRRIAQVACGEHHVVVLVGCPCTPFTTNHSITECNTSEVFAWGENFLGQVIQSKESNFVTQPVLLTQFSGKNIKGVAAYKCSSLAFDDKEIYQWGVIAHPKLQIQNFSNVSMGSEYIIGLNTQKQVLIIGKLTNTLTYKQFTKIHEGVSQIAAGDNHILMLQEDGTAMGLGSNKFCQLGSKAKDQYYEPLAIIPECFSVSASQNSSMFVSEEGEVLYCGQITEKLIIDYPKSCQIADETQIIQAYCYNSQLYALNLRGKLFKWDPENEPKFKEFLSGGIRQLSCTKGVRIVQSGCLWGEWCRVEIEQEEQYACEDLEIIINLGDEFGPYGIKLQHPCRYAIQIEREILKDIPDIREYSKKLINSQQDNKIYLTEINSIALKAQINLSEDPTKHILKLQLPDPGQYYLYIFLNDQLCIDCPLQLQLEVGESAQQEELKRQDELKALIQKQEKEKLERLAKLQQQEDMRRQQSLKEEQEAKKIRETQQRAQQTLQQHQVKQQQEQQQQELERQLKKDALTGGGFDLSKIKQTSELQEIKRKDFSIKSNKSQPQKLGPVRLPIKSTKIDQQFQTQQTFKQTDVFGRTDPTQLMQLKRKK